MFYYDCLKTIEKGNTPLWPEGVGNIPVILPEGTKYELPIHKGVNYLTLGGTGTGKTRSFTEKAARILLDSDAGTKAVFFEIKNEFLKEFLEPNDKVITYDPNAVLTQNLFVPSLIQEIRQAEDAEAEMRDITEFLFGDLLNGAGQNRAWIEAARNTFIGILRTIMYYPDLKMTNKMLVNELRHMSTKEILAFMSKCPRNHSMLRKDWNYDPEHPQEYVPTRRSFDILFFLNQVLEKNFSGTFAMEGDDTIHNWINGQYGRSLFILYDVSTAEISRGFVLYYIKKIIQIKLSNSTITGPILMVMDEIDKLSDHGVPADFSIFTAANLGREGGLQILLTTQSIENLYALSPDFNEHVTMGGIAGFPVTIAFRTNDPPTLNVLQHLYGSEYREHLVMQLSRYTAPVVQSELQPIVTDAEFASLAAGEAYVKIFNCRPKKIKFIDHY